MYNLAKVTKKLYDSELSLFTVNSLKSLLEISSESTFYNLIDRLAQNDVLNRIEKGKYRLKDANIHEYQIANFIYRPSYISFESALSFYGILSQFPQSIYSSTTKRSQEKITANKHYIYHHLKKDCFGGYLKKEEFLIATPEKALVDQIYLVSKGIKNIDIDGLNLAKINIDEFNDWKEIFPQNRKFKKLIKDVNNVG